MRKSTTICFSEMAAVAAAALALRLAMAWAIPLANGSADPNCAPDEASHFIFTRALSTGRAPTWPDQTSSIYGAFLPTPYFFQAATLAVAGDRADVGRFQPAADWAHGYEAARLGSALLGLITVLALMVAAGTWAGSRAAALTVGLAAALHPALVFVNAYTNADSFTICAGALFVLALARWARGGEGHHGIVWVGAAGGLVVLGKMSGYYLLPVTAPWLVWAVWRRRLGLKPSLLAVGAFAVVAVPALVWNALRNGGDILGLHRYHQFLAEVWHGKVGGQIPTAGRWFVSFLSRSSFGVFKNAGLPLPSPFYLLAAVLLGLGVAAALASLPHATDTDRRGAAWVGAAVIA